MRLWVVPYVLSSTNCWVCLNFTLCISVKPRVFVKCSRLWSFVRLYFVLVPVGPPVLVLVLDDIVLATRLLSMIGVIMHGLRSLPGASSLPPKQWTKPAFAFPANVSLYFCYSFTWSWRDRWLSWPRLCHGAEWTAWTTHLIISPLSADLHSFSPNQNSRSNH